MGRVSSRSSASAGSERRPRSLAKVREEPNEKEGHIPRPPNAWLLFRAAYNKAIQLKQAKAGEKPQQQAKLSQVIGNIWRSSSAATKAPFYALANLEKEKHKRKYPNYKFSPQPKGSKPKKARKKTVVEEPAPADEDDAQDDTTAETRTIHWNPVEMPPVQVQTEVIGTTPPKDGPGAEEDADEQLVAAYLDHESSSDSDSESESLIGDEVYLVPVEEMYLRPALRPVTEDQPPESYCGSVHPYPSSHPPNHYSALANIVELLITPTLGLVDEPSAPYMGLVEQAYATSLRDDDSTVANFEDLFIEYDQPESVLLD